MGIRAPILEPTPFDRVKLAEGGDPAIAKAINKAARGTVDRREHARWSARWLAESGLIFYQGGGAGWQFTDLGVVSVHAEDLVTAILKARAAAYTAAAEQIEEG